MSAKERLFTFLVASVTLCWAAQASAEKEPPISTYTPDTLRAACQLAGGVWSPPGDAPGGGYYCVFPDGTLIACGSDNVCTVNTRVGSSLDALWQRIFLVSRAILDKRDEGPADLVALPLPASTLPFGLCKRNTSGQLLIDVYNQGGTQAGASTTRVVFDNAGPLDVATPVLAARTGTQLVVSIPNACFNANNECRFLVGLDALRVVAESNETNNDAAGACGPQFQ